MTESFEGVPPPERETPDAGEAPGAESQTNGQDRQADSAPSSEKSKAISSLTDVDAIRQYLNRIGAQPRGLRSAVVQEREGRYSRDVATIHFGKEGGEVTVKGEDPDCFEPTDLERQLIAEAVKTVKWPELKKLHSIIDPHPMIKDADPDDVYEFRDTDGQIVMLQVRIEKDGEKDYLPFTYWSDEKWRIAEPEGLLPLYGLDSLPGQATAFLHEGAKAARAMRKLTEDSREGRELRAAHPWGAELDGAVHLGWIGGAPNPHRTDWSVLEKAGIKRVYVVADNDHPGRSAVPKIARRLRLPTFAVLFTDEFPVSFDLADDFPPSMFDRNERYAGPEFAAMIEPATWATNKVDREGGGKPIIRLREHFKSQWVYADEPELFVCKEDPRIIRSAANLSNKLVKYSDTPGTARLLLEACDQVSTLAYVPQEQGAQRRAAGTLAVRGQRAFNVYRPPSVKRCKGSVEPWLAFLAYIFPKEDERQQVMRWCATLIAQPQVRMHFGLLLASRTQGVGKGIFASQVLAPLVGDHNVGYPSEHDIAESQFNDWMAHKRLVVVGEIYQGSSWKAYNRLKGVITDKDFSVNKKHQAQYRIDNWCHVIACSNSEMSLKMERSDRRWFYPQVTETPWTRGKFADFITWLRGDGLGIVARWASEFGDYVRTGELPAMTARKQVMIEESEPEELRWVREFCQEAVATDEILVISTAIALAYAKRSIGKAIYTTKRELGLAMQEAGMARAADADGGEFFVKFLNEKHRPFLTEAAVVELNKGGSAFDKPAWFRKKLSETKGKLLDAM